MKTAKDVKISGEPKHFMSGRRVKILIWDPVYLLLLGETAGEKHIIQEDVDGLRAFKESGIPVALWDNKLLEGLNHFKQ